MSKCKELFAASALCAGVQSALHRHGSVFALFRSADGHRPQRRFVVVEHEDGEESVVLDDVAGSGPADLEAMDGIDD